MSNRVSFVFMIFFLTAVLIFTVHLRTMQSRTFYKLRSASIEQARLKQVLWEKQLQLEKLTSPAAVSRRLYGQ